MNVPYSLASNHCQAILAQNGTSHSRIEGKYNFVPGLKDNGAVDICTTLKQRVEKIVNFLGRHGLA
jgi:hypothetical protein